ncbi:alpha/beta fold hydrolase [Polaribacter sp. IC073]|uniref:alpha/beta fold hydrolase n=1 Tax=Polaribacter sp. IC073 TaxID=2508540 RepID=UPI0011BEB550|nr:alpha/beta fold hydrolase [Polaribacter sp. IC073]TXD47932.1 alpha/beta fold hydrolase [Polaribacter sp. IC073]
MSKNPILHSTIKGEGTPLLILHGYFGMSDNWKTLGNQFSEDFQVHLIDQRNHGRSFQEDEFNYEVLVEDLYSYIQYYKLEKVCIIGHSMGGKTAMLFAVTYPELVEKLIVVDISPREYQPHHNAILAGLNSIDFTVDNSRGKVDKKLAELIPELGVRQFLLKNVYWVEKGQLGFRFNLESLTNNNSEVGEGLPSFTIFEKETLFLKGEKSAYITENEVPIIEAHFPNSKIVEIKNAGHWLHAENPKQFYSEVCTFLK